MTLQIEFLDENPLSTLVPVHTLKPDEVCIFVDKSRQHLKNHKFMEESLKTWDNQLKITDEFLDISNLEEIERVIEELIRKHQRDKIYIDITGGPELMTAAGLHSAFQHDNVIPVYLNPKSNSLIDVQKKEKNVPCSMISLDDYAAAIGAKRIHTYDDTIADNKKTLIYSSAEKFMEDYETWNALSRYISKQYKEDVGYVTIPNTIREDKKSYTVSGMLKDLIQLNCLESAAPLKYRFKGEDAKHLIVKSGVLLEMYIYFKAKEVFGNALTSVEFDWDTSDNKCSVDNELDVIAMKKSRPIFISCKMRKLTREHIYEISAVARRFGNSNVIPLLATTYDFKNDHEILDRARFMKVGLIYAQDFNESNKTASEIFNTAINSVAG